MEDLLIPESHLEDTKCLEEDIGYSDLVFEGSSAYLVSNDFLKEGDNKDSEQFFVLLSVKPVNEQLCTVWV